MLELSLIMLAAGDSTRFNLPTKKQFLRIKSDPLWLYATKKLSSFYTFKHIIVTSGNISYMKKFAPHYDFVQGGATRAQSLKNALEKVQTPWVMVSDVARVDIPQSLFLRLIENALHADCITPALKVADTALYANDEALQREKIKLIQTPQLSRTSLLQKALNLNADFSDDSTAMSAVGAKVWFVEGDERAKKLTFKEDLASFNLPAPSAEVFSGNGFDVHEFGENRALILGGIKVHESMGLKAHSDGDAIAHALTDALLGGASLGDIGEHFPDTDEAYKNADSMQLLSKVYTLVKQYGFELVNADISVIAQAPKLGKFKELIAKNIASCLGVSEFRVNVKATTTEGLGFVGRKEGIAVLASVNLKYFDWTQL
ncbi:bifunctional 2-C-methyl-D-erythritol 4-phosphate cytidylyltransferase/2-C-methyl-D-erythritol 2,4-cyclodiphosphate synthase [Campylobacter sp. MIT 12-5580]|uniref:bifunctional 2-C-methyl-D-erythritol 4-phosphate cytidylyltransferase/2-C-methyl-D-erythritol 2,4-cyclodiphosphate synthase n=1 Tax=Campylobacter sp. MIT 12-5580 TaxID=2040651 RepID=UPI0010F49896|nr:bifunctional 2-C-methyl-D-erythritol 4-phosphate cytidylyltransferase/2-C-methyl-D-erythritol 2,4-cyclodiphosphate synthase [Campylobacter sp. MIT 12-5580]TKX28524.1 bifunctional 2-C-methyl-D-erythritol 4-phosphate cytidylyltransferase/2-C-methyl-D-erythritol 2,4-cyclodiphosphate synthase [Campylobacter sp. MIT 12-5580]